MDADLNQRRHGYQYLRAVLIGKTNIIMAQNRYIQLVEQATGASFRPGNRFTLLQNGDEIFAAMLAAIKGARTSVNLLTYVFWRSAIANQFAEALCERARAGVQVRLLVDAVGAATMSSRVVWQLERAGVQVGWFRPGHLPSLRKLNNRTHRKILLVDDRLGFTGGIGIADVWTGNAQGPGHWRETHCQVQGPACLDLHAGFAENWQEATGRQLPVPATPRASRAAAAIAVHTTISTAGVRPTLIERLLSAVFDTAKHRLWITTAYFVPSQEVVRQLVAAAGRGVDVRILTNGSNTDHQITLHAGRASYTELLANGIKLYEYQKTTLHAKIITADGAWATIGSANLDARSLVLNDELNVSVVAPVIVSQLDSHFLIDLEHSRQIQPAEWGERGRLARLAETSSNVLRHQL